MIKRKHIGTYWKNICYNKVEYSIYEGPYCKTINSKVPLCMSDLYNRNIILHLFHVDNTEVESCIVYYMIIGRELMVHLGLKYNSNSYVIQ